MATAPGEHGGKVKMVVELYDGARRSGRRQSHLMKHMVPEIGADMGKIEEDLTERARMLLTWNMDAVIEQELRQLNKRIAAMEAGVLKMKSVNEDLEQLPI
jgi:hypothetical protein